MSSEERDIVMVIPSERLPPGFAQRIGEVTPSPASPRPAATAVLMRDGEDGIEILLLKRLRSSGFVPGAYVFAGGRVDEADNDTAMRDRVRGGQTGVPHTPPVEYWVATIREVFEESGVLLARDAAGASAHATLDGADIARMRDELMTSAATMHDIFKQCDLYPDFDALAYAAHWITPLAEPRRYDTRFFYAALPAGGEATADAREMCDAVWLTPRAALERFREGALPMVFPTVRTIEDLLSFQNVEDAFRAVRGTTIKPILPSLVRVGDGVGIAIDGADGRARKNKE